MSALDRATIRRATLAAREALENLDETGRADLARIYEQAAAALRQAIAGHGGPDGNLALQELRAVLSQVEGILDGLGVARSGVLTAGIQQAAGLGAGAVVEASASMTVADAAVQFVLHFTQADGLNLSERLWRLDRGAKEAITRQLELAVVQGQSAIEAAREFLMRGQAVPAEVAGRMGEANAARLGEQAARVMTGEGGSALYQAHRVFRTEINRAHGEAYMAGAEDHPDFAGFRFELSPMHPGPDICDLLASQNLHGLGPGVYPSREKCPWPAHPNTLSFVSVVYRDEISAADRAGKETPLEALERLPAETRQGVLGKGKAELFDEGKLSQGMIRTPLGKVRERFS